MTHAHRRWHAWLWLLLSPLVWAGFLAALLWRAPETEGAARSGPRQDIRAGLNPPTRRGPS